jgi:hypothetical protein
MELTSFPSQEPSKSVKLVTRLTLLLLVGILLVTVLTGGIGALFLLVLALLVLIATIPYLCRPKIYTIGPQGVTVVMTLISRTIPDIVSVERLPEPARLKYRVFGIGGLFSIVGRFTTAAGGRVTAYLTDETQGHVVEIRTTEGERVLISPRDPVAFVSAWLARGVAERAHGTIPSRPT